MRRKLGHREAFLSKLDGWREDLLHGQFPASEALDCVHPTGGGAGHCHAVDALGRKITVLAVRKTDGLSDGLERVSCA